MGGSPAVLEWRKRVEAGALPGPTIYPAGPFVNEPRVNTPEGVERDIVAQAKASYDLIKFHELFPYDQRFISSGVSQHGRNGTAHRHSAHRTRSGKSWHR